MRRIFVFMLCLSALCLAAAPAAPKKAPEKKTAAKKRPAPKLNIICTPATHIAKVGEKITFKITSDSKAPIKVTISLDGSREKVFKELTVTAPAEVTASLPYPGFLQCMVRSGRTRFRQAVAVAPEKIRYARKAPADFDQFWTKALEESKKLPLDLKCEPINPHKKYNSFLLNCANVNGKRAYALYAYPKNAKGKMPLLVVFGGGEAYFCRTTVPGGAADARNRFKQDMAVLYLHLPPYAPVANVKEARARHKEFLKKLGLRRYILIGMDDPKTFYGYSAILGCLRLLNAVAARPEIDRKNVVFHGASHGGKFGAYIARFFPLKAAFLGVPSSCEINAFLEGRYGSALREWRKYWKTTDYYDLVYFAPRIKCPVLVGVGFIDLSCPPTGVYSFYNALPEGNKRILNKIHHGHGDSPKGYGPATWKFITDAVSRKK